MKFVNNQSPLIQYQQRSLVPYAIDLEKSTDEYFTFFDKKIRKGEIFIDLSRNDTYNLPTIILSWLSLFLFTRQLPHVVGSFFVSKSWNASKVKSTRQFGLRVTLRSQILRRFISFLIWEKSRNSLFGSQTTFIHRSSVLRIVFPAKGFLFNSKLEFSELERLLPFKQRIQDFLLNLLPYHRLKPWVFVLSLDGLSATQQTLFIEQLRLTLFDPENF